MAGPRKIGLIRGTTAATQEPNDNLPKKRGVGPEDAARLAQQAGFQRLKKRRRGGFDIGDSTQAPIPLPDDELDADAWGQESLDNVRKQLDIAGPQLAQLADELGGDAEAELGHTLAEGFFLPTEQDIARMSSLAEQALKRPTLDLSEVRTNARNLLGLELSDEEPLAKQLMAVGLAVAGVDEGLDRVSDGAERNHDLIRSLHIVTKKANQAVVEAQKMGRGIDEQLSVHRTFVFKR